MIMSFFFKTLHDCALGLVTFLREANISPTLPEFLANSMQEQSASRYFVAHAYFLSFVKNLCCVSISTLKMLHFCF